jgi:lysophospholipase L1-like esterase
MLSKSTLGQIGFWLLLPVSLLQGLRLRKTAIRLPRAEGAESGVFGQGEPVYFLAIGDSIIAGVGTGIVEKSLPVQLAKKLAEHHDRSVLWRVAGSNGADIAQLREKIRQINDLQALDIILVSIGVNDVTGLSNARYWLEQLKSLVTELRQKWPRARIVFAGLPPMGDFPLPPQPLRFSLGLRAAKFDKIAADLIARQDGMLHIPTDIDPLHHEFCEDGFHPSASACELWAEVLAQRLKSDTLAK